MQEQTVRRKNWCEKVKAAIVLEGAILLMVGMIFLEHVDLFSKHVVETTMEGTIKWVDFNISYEALCKAYEYDVNTYGEKCHLNWIELLAYVAAIGIVQVSRYVKRFYVRRFANNVNRRMKKNLTEAKNNCIKNELKYT